MHLQTAPMLNLPTLKRETKINLQYKSQNLRTEGPWERTEWWERSSWPDIPCCHDHHLQAEEDLPWSTVLVCGEQRNGALVLLQDWWKILPTRRWVNMKKTLHRVHLALDLSLAKAGLKIRHLCSDLSVLEILMFPDKLMETPPSPQNPNQNPNKAVNVSN